jgi:hypothetical protein
MNFETPQVVVSCVDALSGSPVSGVLINLKKEGFQTSDEGLTDG